MEVIGVQKEDSFYRVACLSLVNKELSIKFLEKEEATPSFEKDAYVVTGIDGQDLLIRHLKTPLKKEGALDKTLPFQLESLIPYSLEEVVVKPLYIVGKEGTEATFFTVSKGNLGKHITSFQETGLDPEGVSATPVALRRFAQFFCPTLFSITVFYVGEKSIQIVSIEEGKIGSHLTIHIGSSDFNDSQVVSKLKREVDRAFCFLSHKEGEKEERRILFCGEMARKMESILQDYEGCTLTPVDIEGQQGFDPQTLLPFAIPIGLALDALKNDRESIQFRQEEFVSTHSFGMIKKRLIRGGAIALALLVALALSSHLHLKREEKKLLGRTQKIASRYEGEIPALKEIDYQKGIDEVLAHLNQSLRVPKGEDSYFASPPLVSDLLAFLSDHPNLKEIEILRVEYTLKNYPSLGNPKETYRPKAHLFFTSSEGKKAREFHDAIVDDGGFIDENEDIEWNRNEDEYEIAFFLSA
ncbi:hypothetical protein [Candidatus Neptunochlamydia vexilliferae]|nr:hypothetical protein [Candidatus Neptunochlamydia vexilliferae]